MRWLFKEEPTHYGFNDLARDRKTAWTGVRNPLAQKNLHMVRKADEILYYHTGDEKAVVGIARAAGGAYPDPEDPSGKRAAVDIVPVRKLARPVSLAEIKGRALFRDFPLVRLPRLSVLPVGDREWETILRMSEEK
jgi:predicted RNA-binding protein with PUA-like domain